MPATISVRDLRKAYGKVRAVDGVTFEVARGEFFGILGPNGAGKTTTLEILEGLREADSGEVTVLGKRPWPRDPSLLPLIGVQLQASSFFEQLTAREQLRTFASLYGVGDQRADAMLGVVGLEDQAGTRTEKLSGGQAQRLSIACALVHDPELLFLDEPTGALDPQARRNLWDLLRKISAEGRTVVLTTHHMDEAESLCNRVAIMDHGKILKTGPPAALIRELDQPLRVSVESGLLSPAEAEAIAGAGQGAIENVTDDGVSLTIATRDPADVLAAGRAAGVGRHAGGRLPGADRARVPCLAGQQPGRLLGRAVRGQPDVVHRSPALAGEQELSVAGQRRDPVEHRFPVAPVPLHHCLGIHQVGDLAAARFDADQVPPAEQVRPHPPRGPLEVVEVGHALAVQADPDHLQWLQRGRVAADQFAGAVAGEHAAIRGADPPPLAVERDRAEQVQAARVPAQGDALPPRQLPKVRTDAADALAEQFRWQRRTRPGLRRAEFVPLQRGLPVPAGALPHRALGDGQALGEAAPGMGHAAQYPQPVKPQRATSSPGAVRRSPALALAATQTSCQPVH